MIRHEISHSTWKEALSKLSKIKILVLGDLILDEYLMGMVNRISPEAPVPVVWIKNEKQTLGGAGNVIKNLNSIGVKTDLSARIGNDSAGTSLIQLLKKEGIQNPDDFLLVSEITRTILKTRIIAGNQQVCRVDREEISLLNNDQEKVVLQKIESKLDQYSAIILSDYEKGFLTPNIITQVISLSKSKGIPVVVDPQVSHFFSYQGIQCMTPNHHEAGKALGRSLVSDKEVEIGAKEIAQRLNADSIMITRGEKGMLVYEAIAERSTLIPTVAKEVFDVTGAGDTVISIYTAFLAVGMSTVHASLIANSAAGIVVGKLGAESVTIPELEIELKKQAIVGKSET